MDEGQARARIGESVDRYVLEGLLGTGGFGAVYRARHAHMGRQVALKVLHPHPPPTEEMQQRFLREAQAAAAITEPGIVHVYDCGITPKGEAFLAMELLDGEDLADHLTARGPLTIGRAVELTMAVLRPLGAAHAAGVVHRDLKPANVFLTAGGVKLLDFGISKLEGDGVAPLTKTGVVMGTPHYMAPETFRGAATVDHRADLYAVGAMLFEMLTGRPPHDADTYERLVVKVATQPAPALATVIPDAPPGLARAVDRALSTDPAQRFSSASELAAALAPFESDRSRLGSAHTAAMPSTPPVGGTGSMPATRPGTPTPQVVQPAVAATPPPSIAAGTPVTHPHREPPVPSSRRWLLVAGAVVLGLATAVTVPLVLDAVSGADPKQVASEATGAPPAAGSPASTAKPTATPPPSPSPTPSAENRAPSPTPSAENRAPSPTPTPTPTPSAENRAPTPSAENRAPTPSPTPSAENRAPTPSAENRAPTPTLAAGPDSLRIGQPRIVGGLSASAVHAEATGRRGALRRCRERTPVDVKVQLLVSAGGRIAIAQPDPTQDPGPPEAARCVANVLREIGRLPDGGQGVAFLSVHLPAR